MKMKLTLLFILTTSYCFSQEKVNNNDLRNSSLIIKINQLNGSRFEINKNSTDQYSLTKTINKEVTKTKFSQEKFEDFDKQFVEKFIFMKYMSSQAPKKCKVYFELSMRSEDFSICTNEDKKIKIVNNMIKKLK